MKTTIFAILLILLNINIVFSKDIRTGGENGDYWNVGDIVKIDFDNQYFENDVQVLLWDAQNGEFKELKITNNVEGVIQCYLPSNLSPGKHYKIRIVDLNDKNIFTQSDGFIEIYKENSQVNSIESDLRIVENIDFFPNPAKDIISILTNKNIIKILIFDINGKRIDLSNLRVNKNQINIEKFLDGVYFMKIETEDNTIVKKFIKSR